MDVAYRRLNSAACGKNLFVPISLASLTRLLDDCSSKHHRDALIQEYEDFIRDNHDGLDYPPAPETGAGIDTLHAVEELSDDDREMILKAKRRKRMHRP